MNIIKRSRERRARKLTVYRRADGTWAWRLRDLNGQIVATDGGQGYDSVVRAIDMAESITGNKAELEPREI